MTPGEKPAILSSVYYAITLKLPAEHLESGDDIMYDSKIQSEMTDSLYDAILSLRDREDCYRFFDDLCTVGEIQAMAQRWMVARMLRKGETFSAINGETGVSSATITRVRRCLVYGADGYNRVMDRLEQEKQDS